MTFSYHRLHSAGFPIFQICHEERGSSAELSWNFNTADEFYHFANVGYNLRAYPRIHSGLTFARIDYTFHLDPNQWEFIGGRVSDREFTSDQFTSGPFKGIEDVFTRQCRLWRKARA